VRVWWYFVSLYSDLLKNPLIVPLKILRGHSVVDNFGKTVIIFSTNGAFITPHAHTDVSTHARTHTHTHTLTTHIHITVLFICSFVYRHTWHQISSSPAMAVYSRSWLTYQIVYMTSTPHLMLCNINQIYTLFLIKLVEPLWAQFVRCLLIYMQAFITLIMLVHAWGLDFFKQVVPTKFLHVLQSFLFKTRIHFSTCILEQMFLDKM